ncbi:MAG: hypothetical protein D6683_02720 [Actinomyces sp.]|nr:MAG: hypothetical protein D6683_02720 [Actinomyces sp.]
MTTDTRTLHVLGRRPWAELAPLLDGLQGAWADLDGWHTGALPAAAPLATHVWAWGEAGDGPLVRLRVDGPDAIGSALTPVGASLPGGEGLVVTTETVEVDVATGYPWNEDQRLSAALPRDSIWELHVLVDPAPVTFVRPGHRA